MDEAAISNVAGESNHVRVQVLTPGGVLDRDKQLGALLELTDMVAAAASDCLRRQRVPGITGDGHDLVTPAASLTCDPTTLAIAEVRSLLSRVPV